MKKSVVWILIAVLLVALISGAAFLYSKLSDDYEAQRLAEKQTDEAGDEESMKVPDFIVSDAEGNMVKLSDFKGKPIVLNFWATWCHYCKEGMPHFEEAYKKYPDVQFVMVNATDGVQETMDKAKDYIKSKNYTFDVYYDTMINAVRNYGVSGLPMTFFIDRDFNLVTYANGMINMQTLEKAINLIK